MDLTLDRAGLDAAIRRVGEASDYGLHLARVREEPAAGEVTFSADHVGAAG